MSIGILFLVLVLSVGMTISVFSEDGRDAVMPILFIASYIVVVLFIIHIQRPTAIDVYKGKTALEITYRDSISIDSVVVWKEQIK